MTAACPSFQHYRDISKVRAVKHIPLAPKPIHKSRKMMHITTAGFPICLLVCNQSTYNTHDMCKLKSMEMNWGRREIFPVLLVCGDWWAHSRRVSPSPGRDRAHPKQWNNSVWVCVCACAASSFCEEKLQSEICLPTKNQWSTWRIDSSPFCDSVHSALLGWRPSHATSDKTDNIVNWKYITNCAVLKCFAISKQLFQVIWRGK